MKILGLITARGNSKGLKRKNIKRFIDKPLIAHTIEQSNDCLNLFYRVVVSTEDKEIAEISRNYGADLPFLRPKKLSNDDSTSLDVVKYTLHKIEGIDKVNIDWVMILQPTSPLRKTEDIEKCIKIINKRKCDTVVSVKNVNNSHPNKVKVVNNEGYLEPYDLNNFSHIRRQELSPQVFQTNGAIFLIHRSLIEKNIIFGNKVIPYEMPLERSIDIDTELDFRIAEFLYNNYKS